MTYHSSTYTQPHWIHQSIYTFTQWIQTQSQHDLETLNLLCEHSHDILSSLNDIHLGELVPVEMMLDDLNTQPRMTDATP